MFQLDDSKSLHKKWWFHHFHPLKKWLFRVPGRAIQNNQSVAFIQHHFFLLYFPGFAHPAVNAKATFSGVLSFPSDFGKKNLFFWPLQKFFTAQNNFASISPKMTQQRISDSERPRNRSKLTQVLVERRHLW